MPPPAMTTLFRYVGPEAIRLEAVTAPAGTPIDSPAALVRWRRAHPDEDRGWVTYVITATGELRVAPRRSEHVACASGGPVRAAGELRVGPAGEVLEVTNTSTGYCPAEDCWPAVEAALDAAGLEHPRELTFVAVFRSCPQCQARNLVKDAWFVCALCGAALPRAWNFGEVEAVP